MMCGDFGAFDVLTFKTDAQGVDSRKRIHCIVKAVIDHRDERHLVIQDAADLFKPIFALVGMPPGLQVSSQLAVKSIVPQLCDAKPVAAVVSGCSTSQAELVILRVKYYVDALVAVHRTRQRDNPLLTVDKPTHPCGARRPWVVSSRPRLLSALPKQKRRNWKTSIKRIDQFWSLALLPDVLPLKLRYHDVP